MPRNRIIHLASKICETPVELQRKDCDIRVELAGGFSKEDGAVSYETAKLYNDLDWIRHQYDIDLICAVESL